MANELAVYVGRQLDAKRDSMVSLMGGNPKRFERFRRAAALACQDSRLAKCQPLSVLQSCIKVAELNLDMSPALGQAYLVPFKGICTLIIGYRGLEALAYRSGIVTRVEAHWVGENDHFEWRPGTDAPITHHPSFPRGGPSVAWATAHLRDNPIPLSWAMDRTEIDAVRRRSRAADNGPWVTDYNMMARKTVLRALLNRLPFSGDADRPLIRAIEIDNEQYDVVSVQESAPGRIRRLVSRDQEPDVEPEEVTQEVQVDDFPDRVPDDFDPEAN